MSSTTSSSTATTTGRVCATEIESDFSATVKTVAAASSASATAALLSVEASEIADYAAETETLLKQYSDEANALLPTVATALQGRIASADEVENATQQLQTLVDAVDSETVAAVSDKTQAEADKVSVAKSAAESERFNQQTIASEEYIARLNTNIPVLEKELEAAYNNSDEPIGLEAFLIAEELRMLEDLRENEKFFLQDHAHEAGVNARKARTTVRVSRVLYTSNIERRASGELKLQQCKDFLDSLRP